MWIDPIYSSPTASTTATGIRKRGVAEWCPTARFSHEGVETTEMRGVAVAEQETRKAWGVVFYRGRWRTHLIQMSE